MSFNKEISKIEISAFPPFHFRGDIVVINTEEDCLQAVKLLQQEPLLGFDTETKPSFKKGEFYHISLLQLSTENTAYLFRLNKFPFTEGLQNLLSNEQILKAGVAVHDDIKGLQKLAPFNSAGFVELATLAKTAGIKTLGLRSLVGLFFNLKMSKKAKLSNWENDKLTLSQIRYAAADAWAGHILYEKFKNLDLV